MFQRWGRRRRGMYRSNMELSCAKGHGRIAFSCRKLLISSVIFRTSFPPSCAELLRDGLLVHDGRSIRKATVCEDSSFT